MDKPDTRTVACLSLTKGITAMFDFVYNWGAPWQIASFIIGLVIGVVFLVKFCDIFVDSASAIAKKLHVSPLVIGLTVVAMGTSCPELAVSTSDSVSTLLHGGNANVALGNVVGSNICNLLLVLGLSALFTPILIKKSICKREFPMLIGFSAVLVLFGVLFGIGSVTGNYAITRIEAIVFLVLMVGYIWYILWSAKHDDPSDDEEEMEALDIKDVPMARAIILTVIGIAGIVLGGELVVFGAKGLALEGSRLIGLNYDLAESLVGLTIVAVGTSLPELVTSVIAAKKGENELALGNVIGSNTFNILFILGIAGAVNPLTTGSQIIIDLIVMMVATLAVFAMSVFGKLGKRQGIALIAMYVAYLAYLVIRTVIAPV